jgi:RNA 3'-terminal phosphate cyclase (ATP)
VKGGEFEFAVGTAGSTTLVLQTVLPALLVATSPSRLRLCGGTHNPLAPPFDFLQRVFLPLVNRMGPRVAATLVRPGFYPAGGGECVITIEPSPGLARLDLVERGAVRRRLACATVSRLPRSIAERELASIERLLGWTQDCLTHAEVDSHGPGNVVTIEIESEHATEMFVGFGRKGSRPRPWPSRPPARRFAIWPRTSRSPSTSRIS